jgi:hypothetical protein
MRRAWRGGVVVLSGLLAAGAAVRPAGAIDLSDTWEVGAGAVHTNHDNDSTLHAVVGWDVYGAYHFNKYHAAEFTYQSQNPKSNQQDVDITYDTRKIMLLYNGTLKTKKPDSKTSPFIDLGVGKFLYKSDAGSESSTIVQIGAGVRYFFSKAWAIRFEGDLWHWHGDKVILPRHGFFAFDLAVGVTYVFGKGGA